MHGTTPTTIDLDNLSFSELELIKLKQLIAKQKPQSTVLSDLTLFFQNNEKVQELLNKEGASKTALIDLFECAAHNGRIDLMSAIIENPNFKKTLEDADLELNLTNQDQLSPIRSITLTLGDCTPKTIKKIFEYHWLEEKIAQENPEELYEIARESNYGVRPSLFKSKVILDAIESEFKKIPHPSSTHEPEQYKSHANFRDAIKKAQAQFNQGIINESSKKEQNPEQQNIKTELEKQLRSQDLVQINPPFELAELPKSIKLALNK
jgi:hypothetical protein